MQFASVWCRCAFKPSLTWWITLLFNMWRNLLLQKNASVLSDFYTLCFRPPYQVIMLCMCYLASSSLDHNYEVVKHRLLKVFLKVSFKVFSPAFFFSWCNKFWKILRVGAAIKWREKRCLREKERQAFNVEEHETVLSSSSSPLCVALLLQAFKTLTKSETLPYLSAKHSDGEQIQHLPSVQFPCCVA